MPHILYGRAWFLRADSLLLLSAWVVIGAIRRAMLISAADGHDDKLSGDAPHIFTSPHFVSMPLFGSYLLPIVVVVFKIFQDSGARRCSPPAGLRAILMSFRIYFAAMPARRADFSSLGGALEDRAFGH